LIADTCKERGCGTIHQQPQSEADMKRDRTLATVARFYRGEASGGN
jgi:hypothetical protein